MSQLRENLNPGLEGDGRPHHLLHVQLESSAAESNVKILVEPPSEEDEDEEEAVKIDGSGHLTKGGGGGGHDSDPPIENENPNEGEECFAEPFKTMHNVSLIPAIERKKEIENAGRKGQAHHRMKRKNTTRNGDGTYVPPYKKKFFRRQASVLPSKFLLGGNIRDPLNLASLSDAKISAELNRVTPQSSPLPIQGEVPVFIPRNPHDPLGLTTGTPENPEDMITIVRSNTNKMRKHRHRKRPGRKRTESECSVGTEMTEEEVVEEQLIRKLSDEAAAAAGQVKDKENANKEIVKPIGIVGKRKRSISEPIVAVTTVEISKPGSSKPKGGNESKVIITLEKKEATPIAKKIVQVIKTSTNENLKQKEIVQQQAEVQTVENMKAKEQEESKKVKIEKQAEPKKSKPDSTEEFERANTGSVSGGTSGGGLESFHRSNKSSDYVPMGSGYSYSPFALDSADYEYYIDPPPYESPTFSNYAGYTPTHAMQPFSPPPMPEIPHFQRRMQMFASGPPRPQQLSLQRVIFQRPFSRKKTHKHKGDPIVSPVIPQPGSRRRSHHHHHNNNNNNHHNHGPKKIGDNKPCTSTSAAAAVAPVPNLAAEVIATKGTAHKDISDGSSKNENKNKYRPKDKVFQFGNYNQYYGYRTSDQADPRLWMLKKIYFEGKDVLDIGCNAGHVTLSIARDFEPRRVHGIDIDFSLVTVARKNIRHYMTRDPNDKSIVFPRSLPMIYGAIQPPPVAGEVSPKMFPYNVSFAHENYVLPSDAMLDTVVPEYDVIVCFSVTKWIHLNFGDDGIKRFFKRVFNHLRNGGIFILEPQPWSSYSKKKKLTEKINTTYKNIKFLPDKFEDFLVKEVGFSSSESLGTPVHHSKGFQRQIFVFKKTENVNPPVVEKSPVFELKESSISVAVASTSNSSKSVTAVIMDDPSFSPEVPDECSSTTNTTNSPFGYAESRRDTNVPTSTSSSISVQQDFQVDSPTNSRTSIGCENETEDIVSSSSDPR